jgi:putative DNA primase/helicase
MGKATPRAGARQQKQRPYPAINVEAIPAELRAVSRWVNWRYRFESPKWKKPTCNAKGRYTDAHNASTWLSFKAAMRNVQNVHSGGGGVSIGFALGHQGHDDLVGVDFDDCLDDQGEIINPDVARWVGDIDSYTERTPSGRGLRVWVKGKIPVDGKRKDERGVEIYAKARYFTVTGQHWEGTPSKIHRRQKALDALWEELFGQTEPEAKPQPNGKPNGHATDSDDELLDLARHARTGAKFTALFDQGDIDSYPSPSEADFGLAGMLAFWTDRNAERMETLFSRSALGQRGKWKDNADYRNRTIARAIAGCKKTYSPPPGRNGRNGSDHGNGDRQPAVNEAIEDPHRLGRLHLQRFRHRGLSTLRFYQGVWHHWTNGAYRQVADPELQSGLVDTIKSEFDRVNREAIRRWEEAGQTIKDRPADKPKVAMVTRTVLSNVMLATSSMGLLPGKIQPPAWIDQKGPCDPLEVVPTHNALVHLPSVVDLLPGNRSDDATVDSRKAILAPTPAFFSTYALDFDFDLDAAVPVEWLKFLHSVWPDDADSIRALQEWMGYVITPDMRQHKIAVLIGPPRSGRGTVARIIRRLVGAENVAGPRLSAFASNFGLEPLIGKALAIIGDARVSGRSDTAAIAEALLSISGEDFLTIDRKHRPAWEGKLPTRIMMISNDIPRLPDDSGALASRFYALRFTQSFFGQEDRDLEEKLVAELPGILLWAIEGWRRFRQRGHLVQPASGQELIDVARDSSSPVGAFVRDRCEVKAGLTITVAALFAEWCEWCESKKRDPGDETGFGRRLHSAVPILITQKRRGRVEQGEKDWVRYYEGIAIRPPALPENP